jgi:oligopeptide/dipeptide ABC transporter ATP-binding protein
MESSEAGKIFSRPAHPYTRGLMDSIPMAGTEENAATPGYLKAIPGTVPDLYNFSSGCRFYERCSYGDDHCARVHPPLEQIEQEHFVACWKAGQLLDQRK